MRLALVRCLRLLLHESAQLSVKESVLKELGRCNLLLLAHVKVSLLPDLGRAEED